MDFGRQYEDVLRRAELFTYIAELIKGCPAEGLIGGEAPLAPEESLAGERQRLGDLLPRVTVVDRRVLCNGASLDLARRPLTLRLFRAFCEAPGGQLAREEVVRHVYQLGDGPLRSERFLESAYGNAVKLISRARIMAASAFGRAAGHGVEWLVHDQERKTWSLYRLRTQYLEQRLRVEDQKMEEMTS